MRLMAAASTCVATPYSTFHGADDHRRIGCHVDRLDVYECEPQSIRALGDLDGADSNARGVRGVGFRRYVCGEY
jgi:hypothetical protein